jgi:hypothetical protein
MSDQLYVSTDAHGVQRVDEGDVVWGLPSPIGAPGEVTTGKAPLVLRDAQALLDDLGERIFLAEPVSDVATADEAGIVVTGTARLLAETAWGVERAAEFALDCAEHVLGDSADAVLPNGATLGAVVADARQVLERSSDAAEKHLGVLARLAAARRLRQRGELLGDLAIEALEDDLTTAMDALDDPAWATVATVRDAVLGAVEAVRHLALPRYIEARERAYEEDSEGADGKRETPAGILMTPWGPITLGAEHQPGYAPAWVAARDTALRARDAVRAQGGDEGTERSWQSQRLVELLQANA